MDDLDDFELSEDDLEEVIEFDDHTGNVDDVQDDEDEGQMDDEDIDDLMESIVDDAVVVFDKHKKSVYCCDLEPTTGKVAVSGGKDDRSYVWNTESGDVLFECTGHKESVTCASFSHDGTYVATADMNGVIQVWEMATKSNIFSAETSSEPLWIQWHQSIHVLLSGTKDGNQWMWRIPAGECKMFYGHKSKTDCGKILADGKTLATGYGDGSIKIWDLKSSTVLHNIAGESAHTDEVFCIDGNRDNTLVMSGSLDGTAKLINSQNGRVLATLNCMSPEDADPQTSVETVGFSSTNSTVCATGTLHGQLGIWDIPKQVQRQVCRHEGGIVRLVWDHVAPLVYTAGLDGVVRLWDSRSGEMVSRWTGHTKQILDVVLLRDGKTILTTSEDKTCRVFHINKPDR